MAWGDSATVVRYAWLPDVHGPGSSNPVGWPRHVSCASFDLPSGSPPVTAASSGRFVWRPDLNRDSILVLGLIVGLAIASGSFASPVDAVNYWNSGSSPDLYPTEWSEVREGLLFYPPPVAQFMHLIQPLGWQVFIVVLMVATFGSLWFCAREWSWPLILIGVPHYLTGNGWLGFPATFLSYALLGNLQWILAALVLVALRHPWVWSLLLVTKVTTAIGWWWHPLRGDRRGARLGAIASAVIVGTSILLNPDLWIEFAGFVARNIGMANPPIPTFPIPLPIRLAMAIALLIWGARTDREWTVSVAVGWSLPALFGVGFLPFWVAPARQIVANRRAPRRDAPSKA